MAILDTNVLVRYLTRDDPDLAQRAFDFLERVERGETAVTLTEAVIVETVQVLSSRNLYSIPREVIQERLGAILRLPGVRCPRKQTYYRALEIYLEYPSLSFVDSLCVAHAEGEATPVVISFDRDFRRVPSVQWQEP